MKTIISLFLISAALTVQSQQSSLDSRELLVQKEYSNEIYEANPLFDYASIYVPRRSALDFSKDTLSGLSPFTPDINVSIRPVPYKTLQENDGHKGFIKLDKGTINPLHAHAGYSYTAANYFNINAAASYDNRAEANIPNKSIKTADATIGMEYYLTNEIKTEINIDYNRNRYGLYGSSEFMDGTETTHTTGYNTIGFDMGLQSFKSSPDKWNFGILTRISEWQNIVDDQKERNIDLTGAIELNINDTWGMSLSPEYVLSQSEAFSNANILKGAYHITYNRRNFYVKSGVQLDYLEEKIRLWPDTDLRWSVAENARINITSGTTSSILGAQYLTEVNPYLSIPHILGAEKMISYNRNLSFNISSSLYGEVQLSVYAGYQNAENDVNFYLSPSDLRTFEFESVNYERLRLAVDLQKKVFGETLAAGINIKYDNYAKYTSTLFHRPILTITPQVVSSLWSNRLQLSISALINSPQDLADIPALSTRSEWRKNISAAVSLRIMDQLNVHFNADNILNDEYQVWNGYDNFGRNLSGGLLFKF